jgi:hypothetical protein
LAPKKAATFTSGTKSSSSAARVHEQRQTRKAQAVEKREPKRHRPPGRIFGEVGFFDDLRRVVEEVAGDEERHGREQEGETHHEARSRKPQGNGVEDLVVRADRAVLEEPGDGSGERKPDQRQERHGQEQRFPEDAAQLRRHHLPPCREGGLENHGA